MKTNRLLFKATLSSFIAASALVLTVGEVMAQVKIGSNPTTIGLSNNLEVEASTAGRKTLIDKTSGQVTIADGTEGLGKIYTSTATGAASWTNGTSAFRAKRNNTLGVTGDLSNYYNINLENAYLNQDQNINFGVTSGYTVLIPGTYLIQGSMIFTNNANSASSIAIFKNGQALETSAGTFNAGTANALTISTIDGANIGDFYEIKVNNNVGGMFVNTATMSGTRVR